MADRIQLALAPPAAWRPAIERFRDWIAEQTLARRLDVVDAIADAGLARHDAQIGEHAVAIGLARSPE
jgi:hypothetical protein